MTRELIDSGIEWIGAIPETWEIIKFKYLFSIIGGNGFPDILQGNTSGDYPFCKVSDINGETDYVESASNWVSQIVVDDNRFSVIPTGSILMAKIGAALAKNHRKVNTVRCCIDNNTQALVPKRNDDIRYLLYLTKCIDMRWFDNNSTVPSINNSKLLNFYVPNIPKREQTAIASVLDNKCAKIDSAIEKTQKTIEEYKALKQSIITEAVTKGIRGDRPMKDSDNTWFGMIPSDWQMMKVKYIFRIKKIIAGEEGHTVLSITQKGIKPKDLSKNEGQIAESYKSYQLLNKGDYAMNHMDLLTGWIDISQYDGVTSPDYRVFTLINENKHDKKYYLYLMQMCYTDKIFYGLGQGVSGMGRWRLQADKFLNFTIPTFTKEEQSEIAEYLDNKCATIDTLISQKETIIKELETYKKSLIYEYVTGKKEVM